jgi:hypothetical protein
LLFVPWPVLEVAADIADGVAAGPSASPFRKIPRGFRDLRAVAGSVKDARFVSQGLPFSWI